MKILSRELDECRGEVAGAGWLIADIARDRGTDRIVMATHGRTGFAHFMLGSVAERMVRIAPCAVLTVPQASRTAWPSRPATAASRCSRRG